MKKAGKSDDEIDREVDKMAGQAYTVAEEILKEEDD